MEENFITIIVDGTERLHEILFTFELDDYDKQYVVFTPVGNQDDEDQDDENQGDEDEDLIHVASYIPDENGVEVGQLFDIEDDEEWASVEEVINTSLKKKRILINYLKKKNKHEHMALPALTGEFFSVPGMFIN